MTQFSKNRRGVLSLLLCLTTIAGMAGAGCGGTKPDTPETTDSIDSDTTPGGTTSYLDTLPIEDFGGYEFNVVGQNTTSRQNFWLEELEGDIINDAIYQRDAAVEERLNITFNYISIADRTQVTTAVQKVIMADEEAYDLIFNSLSDGINTLTSAGQLYDLTSIPYLSLDSELWNRSMLENMTFNGKLYFTTGAISLAYYKTPIAMVMNKRLAEDYQVGDIYSIVLDGKWTVDLLHSLTKDISRDLDNNGIMDENDFYGLSMDGTFGNVLFNSSGFKSVDNTGDYALLLDDARAVDIIENLASKFGSRDVYFNDKNGSGSSAVIYRAGNALFLDYTISGIIGFRDMEDDFAIIPTPKYDESQEVYLTTCNTWLPSGVAVPVNCSNPVRTGLIMETMAYYSNEYITPAVYEITLRGKVSRDDDSSRMLDIIYQNSFFDMVTTFNFSDTALLLRDAVLGEKENFVSSYTAKKSAAQSEVDNIAAFATEN